jgi:hypothetical protein
MVFTAARGGTERGSVLAVMAITSVEKQREIPKEIYEGERPIFQKREERFLRKKERREQRNKKLGKMLKLKVERGIWSF